MMHLFISQRTSSFVTLMIAFVCLAFAAPCFSAVDSVSVSFTIPEYSLTQTDQGVDLKIDDFGTIFEPGKPRLPSRIFAIAVPPGADVLGIQVKCLESELLPGRYAVSPVPHTRIISDRETHDENGMRLYQNNHETVYGSDVPYPAQTGEFVRTAQYRRYNLADVRITPFTYKPLSGSLTFHRKIELTVEYEYSSRSMADELIVDYLPKTEMIASELIYNYHDCQEWYPVEQRDNKAVTHPLVFITTEALEGALDSLLIWEASKGNNPTVVTTEWINTNYTGVDLAQKMRNFLREKYPSGQWGIENVLFVGDYAQVPMRTVWQDIGYGKPRTDFYFAELSKTDNQSWDQDGDGKYLEDYSDSTDFYSEINVGRIPWSNYSTIESICEKSILYEQMRNPNYKKNILYLGAYFWDDTDNAELMEAIDDLPWMSNWSKKKMYEKNADYTSSFSCDHPLLRSNVRTHWSAGMYGFVNWAGHGSPTSAHILGLGSPAFIDSGDCSILNDSYPAIIFADACSNSDTDDLNIGKAMLARGAVGFVGATKVALGCPGWNSSDDGSSQSCDYYFTNYVTSGDYKQGEAHQMALRYLYTHGLWNYNKYEMCEWTLWGNPCLGMTVPVTSTPTLSTLGLAFLLILLSLAFMIPLTRPKKVENTNES
ncbi:hypothetical protein JXQ70_03795 [bacterium]|nr:hypothetical protein [bacterium]